MPRVTKEGVAPNEPTTDEPMLFSPDQVPAAAADPKTDPLRSALEQIAGRQWDTDRETEASMVLRELQQIARNALK